MSVQDKPAHLMDAEGRKQTGVSKALVPAGLGTGSSPFAASDSVSSEHSTLEVSRAAAPGKNVLVPPLGLQGQGLRGVPVLGEGEIPVSPVPTSLNAVCVNKLVWLREAPVPKLWQRAGENAFVLSLREKTDVFPPPPGAVRAV